MPSSTWRSSLAGREAESIAAGSGPEAVTTGAANDLERATRLAWRAVGVWGMDEEFGLVSLAGLPESLRPAADERAADRIGEWVARARASAAETLAAHRSDLERLAALLLERESLEAPEIGLESLRA